MCHKYWFMPHAYLDVAKLTRSPSLSTFQRFVSHSISFLLVIVFVFSGITASYLRQLSHNSSLHFQMTKISADDEAGNSAICCVRMLSGHLTFFHPKWDHHLSTGGIILSFWTNTLKGGGWQTHAGENIITLLFISLWTFDLFSDIFDHRPLPLIWLPYGTSFDT